MAGAQMRGGNSPVARERLCQPDGAGAVPDPGPENAIFLLQSFLHLV
jgi:hypothetical protein